MTFSRRRFLRAAGQSLGIAWVGLNWSARSRSSRGGARGSAVIRELQVQLPHACGGRRCGGHRGADHSDGRHARRARGRRRVLHRPRARDFLLAPGRSISRAASRFSASRARPTIRTRPASRRCRRIGRSSSSSGRAHAILRRHAPADAVRHVLDARLRRQSRWSGLEAARLRRPCTRSSRPSGTTTATTRDSCIDPERPA